ncbi:MAG: hypothetical protein Q9O62_01635 [Ardenticatenia bacterium]|nr:hypothetical protein [Ardenticatenia bacterium]
MCKIKLLIMVVLVALLMSAEPDAVVAQKPASTDLIRKGRLLIRPEDVRPFGNVQVLTPEGTVEKGGQRDHGVLTNWQEGCSIDLVVVVQGGKYVALINSASYKFPSEAAAQAALNDLPDPVIEGLWRSVAKDIPVFDRAVAEALRGQRWHAWQGVDDEGLPAYVLWIQHDSYIAETHINVWPGQDVFGQQLLNHVTDRLIKKITLGVSPLDMSGSQLFTSLLSATPKWWAPDVRADHFEFPQWWHVLAVW